MYDTGYNPTDANRCAPTEDRGEYIDRGYVHDEVAHIFDGVCGHAGLFSTVEDVSHFIKMVLNDGRDIELVEDTDICILSNGEKGYTMPYPMEGYGGQPLHGIFSEIIFHFSGTKSAGIRLYIRNPTEKEK